jgi:hypothetical protein
MQHRKGNGCEYGMFSYAKFGAYGAGSAAGFMPKSGETFRAYLMPAYISLMLMDAKSSNRFFILKGFLIKKELTCRSSRSA